LKLDRDVGLWIEGALAEPGVSLLHLHPRIVVESTQLPPPSIAIPPITLLVATVLVATARVFQCPIMTEDSKIAAYPHVRLA
jgi:PIN domain nuclease of toxin-antitoxin system